MVDFCTYNLPTYSLYTHDGIFEVILAPTYTLPFLCFFVDFALQQRLFYNDLWSR